MVVIILAAGVGSRMYPLTQHTPKCLLNVGNTTVLERTIGIVKEVVPDAQIGIVSGFEHSQICKSLESLGHYSFNIVNPFFKVTNSISSLWFARYWLITDTEVVILNSDVCFDKSVFEKVVNSPEGNFVVVDSSKQCNDADYKVAIKNGFVSTMGKGDLGCTYFGEYCGITKLKAEGGFKLSNKVYDMVLDGRYDTWYETALVEMIKEGFNLGYVEINGLKWVELDSAKDLDQANKLFK